MKFLLFFRSYFSLSNLSTYQRIFFFIIIIIENKIYNQSEDKNVINLNFTLIDLKKFGQGWQNTEQSGDGPTCLIGGQ